MNAHLRFSPTILAVILLSFSACKEEKAASDAGPLGTKISIENAKADVQLDIPKTPKPHDLAGSSRNNVEINNVAYV